MLDFNFKLDKSLELLYNYSQNFQLSIDLIQKLSQQLKLDTFIDTDAYAHILDQPLTNENNAPIKFQRLSIAGSLILLDVDFVGTTIYRVSFSLANQLDDVNASKSHQQAPIIVKKDDTHIVKLDFSKNTHSLLNKNLDNNIEDILLANLKGPTLSHFPINLKYLANLDRLSNSYIDLFNYSDNIAWILQNLYTIELKGIDHDLGGDDWLIKEGIVNSIGKILINDGAQHQIGLFIEYWKDFRYINHEYELETGKMLLGNAYNVLLSMSTNEVNHSIDYISDCRDHIWELGDGNKYQFQFNDDSYLIPSRGGNGQHLNDASKPFPNWDLSLSLNNFIYLPINLLEFIGIRDFKEQSKVSKGCDFLFDKLNNEKELSIVFPRYGANDENNQKNENNGDGTESLKVCIKSDIHSKFIPISAITLKKLVDIPSFLKIFRNHLVLTNLLKQLTEKGDIWQDDSETTVSAKVKDKLKESLKLSNDITDDKILSLGALNEHHHHHHDNRNNDSLDEDISLNEFMKEDSPSKNEHELANNQFTIKINDISYNLKQFDVSVLIQGKFNNKLLNIPFRITNGEIMPNNAEPGSSETSKESDDMVVDDDVIDNNLRFVKCLNLTEDLLESINHTFG